MGLLPSLLIMVVTFLGTTKGDPRSEPGSTGRKTLLGELTGNLSFAIVVALLLITVKIVNINGGPQGGSSSGTDVVRSSDRRQWGLHPNSPHDP
jgi:hypothetical protein